VLTVEANLVLADIDFSGKVGGHRYGACRCETSRRSRTMSWDISLFNAPPGITIEEIPRDYEPAPLGSVAEVLGRLQAAFVDLDLSDPTWGDLERSAWSVEFNIGAEDPVRSIMLHVRGGGDDVVQVVRETAHVLGCRALDCSSGEFIEDGGRDGWADFQAFRDRAFGQGAATREVER
jgi:hypothetical protein